MGYCFRFLTSVASFGGESSISPDTSVPGEVETITFQDGEIISVEIKNHLYLYKRGALVVVSSRYTGTSEAVIIGFQFGCPQLPVLISRGGAEGEMNACVDFDEIAFFPKQTGKGDVVTLRSSFKAVA